jgi:TonB family protein
MDANANPFVTAVGYALVAFVWQGAAVGVVAAAALMMCRKHAASVRYAIGCAALILMAMAPVITVITIVRGHIVAASGSVTTGAATSQTTEATVVPGTLATTPAGNTPNWIASSLPTITAIWAGGVLAGALHLFLGWCRLRRMLRAAIVVSPEGWSHSVRALAARLGVTSRLHILTSTLTEVPAVVGWLRPAIVVPASVLAGLPAAYLDAVLAHELAHLRRRDYLVNALQCAVEVLLFYHPAVWWVSQQVRREREHCCDDEAAAACGDAHVYIRALVSLEELRCERARLALGATGGHLLHRVRRLMEPSFTGGPAVSGGIMIALTLSMMVVVGGLQTAAADPASAPVSQPAAMTTPAIAPAAMPEPAIRTAPVVARPPSRQPRANVTQVAAPVQQTPATGGIDGRVIDADGGVVPGVAVNVSSPLMGAARPLVTDARGEFHANDLNPGTYEVTLRLMGFRPSRGTVTVTSGRRAPVRFRLQVGELEESMTVSGIAAAGAARPEPQTEALVGQSLDALRRTLAGLQARGYSNQHPDVLAIVARIESLEKQTRLPATGSQVPIRVGGDIREPLKLKDATPVYPPDALAAGIQGTVFIEAVLSKDGTVQSARVLQGVTELDDAALTAVRQWLYRPTMLNGQPVEIVMTVTIRFVAR